MNSSEARLRVVGEQERTVEEELAAVRHAKVVVTERDRELFGILALARYLGTEQIGRLMFPGRDESIARRRMTALSGAGRRALRYPYVERLSYRDSEGTPLPVWKLTERGYLTASQVLGSSLSAPAEDVTAMFLDHWLQMNEVFVALMAPTSAEPYARARRTAFRWIGSERVALPWKEYDQVQGKPVARLLRPDGLLEIARPKRRIFLEYETGAHALSDRGKRDSTISKLDRYCKFFFGYAEAAARLTWYARAHPDQWAPELLFVAGSPDRRDSIRAVIEEKRRTEGRLNATALTLPEVCEQLRAAVGSEPLPARVSQIGAKHWVSDAQVALLADFYRDATNTLRDVRHAVRERRPVSEPPYPARTAEVKDLLTTLHARKERKS